MKMEWRERGASKMAEFGVGEEENVFRV